MEIARDKYLEDLKLRMGNGMVKVVTGIRRCGKTYLMFNLFRRHLKEVGVDDAHVIELALDARENAQYRDPDELYRYLSSRIADEGTYYVLLDEVQYAISDDELRGKGSGPLAVYDVLNGLLHHRNVDVYVTGSNSRMLSKDIATEFRGRATQIHVYPLSFEEYYSFAGGDKRSALDQYMLYGGMPRPAGMAEEQAKKEYLSNLYDELYIKDIVERNHLEREDIMNAILDYTASQIGSLTNPTNMANALSSMRHERVNPNLVSDYLTHVMDAFLISMARRYDIKGKTYFNYPNKYYYTDIGLRNARLNYRQYDPGHMMENIVYNELVLRGYSVDVGMVLERKNNEKNQREIDFVVNDGDKRIYIQSAYQIDTEQKESAELQSMKLTGDFFRKIVIRLDIPHNYYDDNGFFHCNLMDFLLGNIELF